MFIKIKIKDCRQCPRFINIPLYMVDSFDSGEIWICRVLNQKIAQVETFDETPEVPEWCPCKIQQEQTMEITEFDDIEDLANANGFQDSKELLSMMANVNLVDPEISELFEKWKDDDGSKKGLAEILDSENGKRHF